jgi:N-acetylglutamate synthase-like GNAT family acetyltransferase
MSDEVATARAEDLTRIRRLLTMVDLPVEGVEEHPENFFVIYEDDKLVGVGGLEVHGPYGLVRSVAVHPTAQRRGVGRALFADIHQRALELGLRELYLLTTSAERFFSRLEFAPVPRKLAPEEIRRCAEFRDLCPDSAVLMRRKLARPAP